MVVSVTVLYIVRTVGAVVPSFFLLWFEDIADGLKNAILDDLFAFFFDAFQFVFDFDKERFHMSEAGLKEVRRFVSNIDNQISGI